MKVIIQIPAFNEQQFLEATFRELPISIDAVDTVETLVIDDGSTDKTADVARALGIPHVLSFPSHRGLASAFAAGMEKCLDLGADIIVNTDADNQYCGQDIQALVRPILEGRADVVVGERPIENTPHFSWMKKRLQKSGSAIVGKLAGIDIRDVASGFRAFSREAALQVDILTEYSHTIETLIQLAQKKFRIVSVPVRTNTPIRRSRLIKSNWTYVSSQMATLLRIYTAYKPLKVFFVISLVPISLGILGFSRAIYFHLAGTGAAHLPSLIVSSGLLLLGFFVLLFGILADLISQNRKLTEKALRKVKELERNRKTKDGDASYFG